MTPANCTKLQKAGRELADLALKHEQHTAQDATLALLRTLELIHGVLVDLALRPEVNDGRATGEETR